jgi:hypothetical protein
MEKIFKRKWVTYILMLILASTIFVFAGDVTVRDGDLEVDGDLNVVGDLDLAGNVVEDLTLEADLYMEGTITQPPGGEYPEAYVSYLYVDYQADMYYVDVSQSLVASNISTSYIYADKIRCDDVDPARVLFDLQTRQQTIDGTKRVVPPEKQGGVVLFFNKDTKKLEMYVPSEGKFYDLQGNLIYTMSKLEVATDYKMVYHLDIMTGEVKSRQELLHDRYMIKKGYRLDAKTGHFINKASGEVVPKETAVELIKAP